MKFELVLKILIIIFCILTVSCIQQDKSITHSDFVVIKYKAGDNNLSRSNLLFNSINKAFHKNNIKLDFLDVEPSYSFEDEIQRQIKDFSRKYIFIFTDYPKDTLKLIATQYPKITFIVLNNNSISISEAESKQNVKYITFNNHAIIEQLAYIAAYWTDSKEGEQGKIAYFYDEKSIYHPYQNAFSKGVTSFNNDYHKNIAVINVNMENQYNHISINNIFDKLIKQNSVVYFIATDQEYFTILKKIQTVRQYAIGLETDFFYYKPEFQDIILISENTDFDYISNTIVEAVNTGHNEQLNITVSPDNKSVDLSPFHNFDTAISNNLKKKLDLSLL